MSAAAEPHAVFETVGDGIARLRINRPDRLGAYTPQMCAEILAAIRQVRLDDSLRVLVLTGTGRGFCTGGDVAPDAGFAEDLTKQIGRPRELREDSHAVITALHKLDKPVVCAVNGIAVNGGLAFALACDVRIVSAGALLPRRRPAGRALGRPECRCARGQSRVPAAQAAKVHWVLSQEFISAKCLPLPALHV